MCGRFTLTAPTDQIQELFHVEALPDLEAHYNIAPTDPVLTMRLDDESERQAEMMRWGLVPVWADDKKMGARLINARSETVHEKPAFRDAFKSRRCLVAADGFLEWKKMQGRKQPFLFKLQDERPFGFAGLWERWRDEEGEWLITCTILTTDANELVEPTHDRMPVILHPEDHELWLDDRATRDDLEELFARQNLITEFVVEESQRNGPPGHQGVHCCPEEPGSHQVPDFFRLLPIAIRGKKAHQAGEVDGAEGNGQNGGPAQSRKADRPQQIIEGIAGRIEIEHLKSKKGHQQDNADDGSAGKTPDVSSQMVKYAVAKIGSHSILSHHDSLLVDKRAGGSCRPVLVRAAFAVPPTARRDLLRGAIPASQGQFLRNYRGRILRPKRRMPWT